MNPPMGPIIDEGTLSASPILNEDGAAIGVVSTSSGGETLDEHREGDPNPLLARQPKVRDHCLRCESPKPG
jgi:hypothetical protein